MKNGQFVYVIDYRKPSLYVHRILITLRTVKFSIQARSAKLATLFSRDQTRTRGKLCQMANQIATVFAMQGRKENSLAYVMTGVGYGSRIRFFCFSAELKNRIMKCRETRRKNKTHK